MNNFNTLVISEISADDIPDMAAIDREISQNPWDRMLFKDEFRAKTFIGFVAKISASMKTAGFVLGRLIDREMEILKIGVDSRYQRQGIGTLLLERLLDCAKSRKMEKVFLEVGSGNLAAQDLYKKAGFRQIHIRAGYYRNAEDAVIMSVSLISQ